MDFYLGMIILWPISWVPVGWALCDGSLLSIDSNDALFSLIGTTYGGDGQATFALPNFKGYISIGTGIKDGHKYQLGQKMGSYSSVVALNLNTLPTHTHTIEGTCNIPETSFPLSFKASANEGNRNIPQTNDALSATTAISGRPVNLYGSNFNTQASLLGIEVAQSAFQMTLTGQTGPTGGSQPISINNVQKSIALNYIIAVQGIYPSRPY